MWFIGFPEVGWEAKPFKSLLCSQHPVWIRKALRLCLKLSLFLSFFLLIKFVVKARSGDPEPFLSYAAKGSAVG